MGDRRNNFRRSASCVSEDTFHRQRRHSLTQLELAPIEVAVERTKSDSTITIDTRPRCSNPVSVLSPRRSSGLEASVKDRKLSKSPRLRVAKIRHRLSRGLSLLEIGKQSPSSSSGSDASSKRKSCELFTFDPRVTNQLALFYLQQLVPNDFPAGMLELLFRKEKSIAKVREILTQSGWNLTTLAVDEPNLPFYYFGRWSYDCWIVFEGVPSGHFLTCHKENRYYLMYKDSSQQIVLQGLSKGPAVSNSILKQLNLVHGIARPLKRMNCIECDSQTPCNVPESQPTHTAVDSPYIITFPT